MPDRLYSPMNPERVRRRDRLWAHWYAFCATLGSIGLGLMITVTGVIRWVHPHRPPHDPTPPTDYKGWERWMNPAPSLAAIPFWQGIFLGAILAVGGIVWTVATLTSFRYVEDYWKLHRAGLLLLALGWLGYVYCAMHMRPEWVVPWWLGLTHVVAYLGGFYLSMLHQWRAKGFPPWVLRVSAVLSPAYEAACKVCGLPFVWAEGVVDRVLERSREKEGRSRVE